MTAAQGVVFGGDDWLTVPMDDAATAQRVAEGLRASQAWLEVVPGLDSLAVRFDPLEKEPGAAVDRLAAALAAPTIAVSEATLTITIDVRYSGADGPDLAEVAETAGLTVDEVIRQHAESDHRVALLGFLPGFAYLDGLDPALDVPRRATPRPRVPAGSVGIAAGRTGVYPVAGPGGWSILGRTDAVLFDADRNPPFLLAPGARVRFRPV